MSSETSYVILGTVLTAFEMAVEEQLADFLTDESTGTGESLAGVRILAGIRDYDLSADDATETKASQNTRATNARKPRVTIVGSEYMRSVGQDKCSIEFIIFVDLKHHARSVYSLIVNQFRTLFSTGMISDFVSTFNTWATQIGTTGYKLQLQGLVPSGPNITGFDGTGVVCRMKYNATGYFKAI